MRRIRLLRIAFLCLAVAAVVIPVLAYWLAREGSGLGHRLRSRRRRNAEARPPLPDDEFAARLGLSGEEIPCWLAIRGAIADECRIARTSVRPEDLTSELGRMSLGGFELASLKDALRRHLGAKVTRRLRLKIVARRRRILRRRYPRADQPERLECFADFAEAVAGAILGGRSRDRMVPMRR